MSRSVGVGTAAARLALILSLLLAGARPLLARAPDIRTDIAYGPDPAEILDLCLPAGPGTGRPAVVVIHGGGWRAGSRKDLLGVCKLFAQRGMVAASIDYRLAGKPDGAWPAQLEDAQLGVRWLRSHADELGIDPARICALGDSAGGHLATFLAVLQRTVPGDRAGTLSDVSSGVACAADNFGPVDFTVPVPFRNALPRLADSHDWSRIEAVARAASPLFLVGPATAPIMIVQGDNDVAVPPAQSAALRDALRRNHVPHWFLAYPGAHSFKGLAPPEREAILLLEAAFVASAPSRPY